MKLKTTPALRQLLRRAAEDTRLPQEVQDLAHTCVASDAAEWSLIKEAHQRLEAIGEPVGPLQQVCQGSGLVFPPPPKPQGKTPELQKHLEQLQARLEQQHYDAMVADVTQAECAAAALREGGLQTYKQQLSFGAHILLMMAAFYAFGHLAGMAFTRNKLWHPLVGLLFMFGVMVLETTLYVIRTTVPPKLHMEAARRAQEARAAQAVAKLRRELEQQQEESSSKAVGKGMQQRHLEQQQGRDTKDASVLPKGRAEKKDN